MRQPTRFLSGRGQVWPALKRAAKKATQPSYAAVAYFGVDGPQWLPLRKGSSLVVDASDEAVKSGQTSPASLKTMARRGVLVYSAPGLHAKVFVFGRVAYVGSANVSGHSAKKLIEAVAIIRQRRFVADARQFVRSHCHGLLGPAELKRLTGIYRRPKWQADAASSEKNLRDRVLRIVRLAPYTPPSFLEPARNEGRKAARRRMEAPKTHEIEDFDWSNTHHFVQNEWLLRITNEGNERLIVSPPGRVVHLQPAHRGGQKKTIVFVEAPKRRGKSIERLGRQLGRGSGKKLQNNRILRDNEIVDRIFEVFRV